MTVRLEVAGHGVFDVAAGGTLLEACEAVGVPMLAECGGKPEEFFRRLREGERLQAAAGREFVDGPVATATQASPARSSPPPPAA